jgi:hypothetical protein
MSTPSLRQAVVAARVCAGSESEWLSTAARAPDAKCKPKVPQILLDPATTAEKYKHTALVGYSGGGRMREQPAFSMASAGAPARPGPDRKV